jgi:hypothetical protein
MSFDLSFYHRGDGFNVADALDYIKSNSFFQVSSAADEGFQARYTNEKTGVYFIVEHHRISSEDDQHDLIVDGYCKTDLSFTLNYMRPSFFAIEAMDFIEDFCRRFELRIDNPQANQDSVIAPRLYLTDDLIAGWQSSNAKAVKAFDPRGKRLNYLPQLKSQFLWRYMKEADGLQEKLGPTIFVPTIFAVRKLESNILATAIVWTDGICQIFPPVDYIILMQKKMFTSQHAMRGYISFSAFYDAIKPHLEPFDHGDMAMHILKPSRASKAKKSFKNLTPDPTIHIVQMLPPDQFVDIERP